MWQPELPDHRPPKPPQELGHAESLAPPLAKVRQTNRLALGPPKVHANRAAATTHVARVRLPWSPLLALVPLEQEEVKHCGKIQTSDHQRITGADANGGADGTALAGGAGDGDGGAGAAGGTGAAGGRARYGFWPALSGCDRLRGSPYRSRSMSSPLHLLVSPLSRNGSGSSSNYSKVNPSSSIGCSHCRHGHTGRAGHAGYATCIHSSSRPQTINYCTHCSSYSYGARRCSQRCSYRCWGSALGTSLESARLTEYSGTCERWNLGRGRSSAR